MRPAKPRLEPRIETENLMLRPLSSNDLDDLVAEINDYDIARMTTRIPHPYARNDAITFLAASRKEAATGAAANLAVEHKGRLIGICGLFAIPHRSEIGYWFGRAHWGQGFATEASRAVLAYAFDVLGLRLVRAGCFTDNPASLRVQMKLGFRRIGVSTSRSLARGADVAHIHSILTPGRFRAANLR